MSLGEAVGRISRVAHKRRLIFPVPVWVHYAMAWLFERTMAIPLTVKAQVRILSESLTEPTLAPDQIPAELMPKTPFSDEQIRKALPVPERFGMKDCLRGTKSV